MPRRRYRAEVNTEPYGLVYSETRSGCQEGGGLFNTWRVSSIGAIAPEEPEATGGIFWDNSWGGSFLESISKTQSPPEHRYLDVSEVPSKDVGGALRAPNALDPVLRLRI